MTLAEVEALINSEITANGDNAIIGTILNNVLQSILTVSLSLVVSCGSGGYTISNGGKTLTGSFLSTTITEIVTNGQAYLITDTFTQDTDTTSITLTDGSSFVTTQKVKLKV